MSEASSSRPAPADNPEQEAQLLTEQGFSVPRDAIRSGSTAEYNCVAWTVDDFQQPWTPMPPIPGPAGFETVGGYFWPEDVPPLMGIETVVQLYENRGFQRCHDATPAEGFDRIAIYGFDGIVCQHVAVQRDGESWSSKMGDNADVEHPDPYAIEAGMIGHVRVLMRRSVGDRPLDARSVATRPVPPRIDIPRRGRRSD
jgi:hypothetical protein